jgi:sugar fermentation stimulation protein A
MLLPELIKGIVIRREKRFKLYFSYEGKTHLAYLPNPGRLQEIIYEGATAYFKETISSRRKTSFEAVLGTQGENLVNLNASAANSIFLENIYRMPFKVGSVKKEYTFKDSRFDFLVNDEILLEVKSCTLVKEGLGLFPDAPTVRGTKHLRTLLEWPGKKAIIFVVQRCDARLITANYDTDPEFGNAFNELFTKADYLLGFTCNVDLSQIKFKEFIPVVRKPE